MTKLIGSSTTLRRHSDSNPARALGHRRGRPHRCLWWWAGLTTVAVLLAGGCSESEQDGRKSKHDVDVKASADVRVIEPSQGSGRPQPLPSLSDVAETRAAAGAILPPPMPKNLNYPHDAVTKTAWGRDGEQFWIFEPAKPTPEKAPVIVFLHGWSEMNPRSYGAWVDHLVRQGNTVIFPRYQASVASNPGTFTPNMMTAVTRAFQVLEEHADRVRPNRDRVAVVGHSMGGLLAANLAALAQEHDLPPFRAVMAVQPGISKLMPLADLSTIPADTLLVTMAGDADRITGSSDAAAIYHRASNVPLSNRLAILLRSDGRGQPPLIADHIVPMGTLETYNAMHIDVADDGEKFKLTLTDLRQGAFEVNAWDYHAFWRPFDQLLTIAFADDAVPGQLAAIAETLGHWSDGAPVRTMDLVNLIAEAQANTAHTE